MIYFSSDHHFSHTNIIRYCNRPFENADEMDETFIQKWNDIIQPGDIVYYIGDFSLSINNLNLVSKLNGDVYLIPGNHDKCFPFVKNNLERRRNLYLEAGFKKILDREMTLDVEGETILINHFPYREENPEFQAKYLEYRPKDLGKWLIHGHIHEKYLKNKRQINVSCDVWDYAPVSLNTIASVMKDSREFIKNLSDLEGKH